MMKKKLSRLLSVIIVTMFTMTTTVYAEPEQRQDNIPYGTKILNLKGKEELQRLLNQIKVVRASIINININERTTEEELKEINKQLEIALAQFDEIKRSVERFENVYKDSFPDILLAERLYLIINTFDISIMSQQQLINALREDRANAVKIVYSSYLIPIYYYITLGDQFIAYNEAYIFRTQT